MPQRETSGGEQPRTLEQRLGHIWGAIFLATVVVLTGLLVGKGCFFSG